MFNLAQCWERMEPQELEWSYLEGFENWETPSTQPHFLVAKANSFHLMRPLSFVCTNMNETALPD